MKHKCISLVAAVLLCNFPTLLFAQDSVPIIEKLERVTKEKEPQWTLDRKLPTERVIVLRWSAGDARVFLSITTTNSPAKAKEIYDSSVTRLNEQWGAKSTKSSAPALGDENQLWTRYDNEGSAVL